MALRMQRQIKLYLQANTWLLCYPKRPVFLVHICVHSGFLLERNFVSYICICLSKFFHAIIGLSCNCFLSWYARDARFSHVWNRELKTAFVCCLKTLSWGGVGGGSAIYRWLLFQYILLDNISIFSLSFDFIKFLFCRLRGCSRVSHLPKRLSSSVFFFFWLTKDSRLR